VQVRPLGRERTHYSLNDDCQRSFVGKQIRIIENGRWVNAEVVAYDDTNRIHTLWFLASNTRKQVSYTNSVFAIVVCLPALCAPMNYFSTCPSPKQVMLLDAPAAGNLILIDPLLVFKRRKLTSGGNSQSGGNSPEVRAGAGVAQVVLRKETFTLAPIAHPLAVQPASSPAFSIQSSPAVSIRSQPVFSIQSASVDERRKCNT
jgi:hypothetical protein